MKALRVGSTLALMTIATMALAMPTFLGVFKTTYKDVLAQKSDTALAKALKTGGCVVCHTTVPKLNAFGADVKKAMTDAKATAVTADVLKKVENLDSDKDGTKNIDEIKAGTLPGDAKSKSPAPVEAPASAEAPAPAEAPKDK